jgi:predicted DNA repair protein MutK
MLGGAYLCFEGSEKLAHRWLHSAAQDSAEHESLRQALDNPTVDLVAFEREKIQGAVRTDFILSAEIITITLGSVAAASFVQQLTVLSGIAVVMTVGVYGLVAAIVKLDDLGLWLAQKPGALARALGRALVGAAPGLMKTLTVVGTAAMFLVGGGILTHGMPPLHHALQAMESTLTAGPLGALGAAVATMLANGLAGVAAGFIVLAGVTLVQRWRR